jgi:hypothetical protein
VKIQGDFNPADLPTDLETLTNEERILFRKMGLSMKPYLLLGTNNKFTIALLVLFLYEFIIQNMLNA